MSNKLANQPPELLNEERRSNWVRLRTLIVLRWIAIVGQLAAITVAQVFFGLVLDIGLCLLAVGALVISNLISIFVYPENKRLSERELTLILLFDVAQLSLLLFLTGGLNNPFAVLILVPVTISATALRTGPTMIIGSAAIALATFVMVFHLPLMEGTGAVLQLPQMFVFGFWAAIIIGVIFLGSYARRVASEITTMSQALLATQMALAREQKITDLAGVVAAAAHELGTPLATIKLASSELMDELSKQPELLEDARLIRDQADRCRDILQSMGRAGKSDLQIQHAPLFEVMREAAEPHSERGKRVNIASSSAGDTSDKQPEIIRSPEIIHGLRNLIQNAVDFAASTVWVDASWDQDNVSVRIVDDGQGFSPDIIGRIGDPFVRRRATSGDENLRPGYKGMGLGLFIAKTLLERSGAELIFANGTSGPSELPVKGTRSGAIVEVVWKKSRLVQSDQENRKALGLNKPIPI